jgi:two-component system capsular synthesis sensor histidine kinase RcsC
MLARVLKGLNYEVAEAEDGAVALEMMRASLNDDGTTHPFDLVLSDFTMPNMDGPESVAGMREAGYTGPVFGVTGNQLQADIDLFIAKGADKVIAKPLKLPALKQAIQEYKEQRRVQGMLMLQSY